MPSTYAHRRMGKDVWKRLPNEWKEEIEKEIDLFKIGLHGPDILFYYRALFPNRVNRIGYEMHDRKARDFFLPALQILRHTKHDEDSAARRAYIYGFICHYVLDKECHPYVEEKITASGISHSEIETEFDRALMVKDGLDPLSHRVTGHIHPSMRTARVISGFFEGISEKEILKALKSMKFYLNILVAPRPLKRGVIIRALKLSGNYENMHGLLVNIEANPECRDSNREMKILYQKAVAEAVELILEFYEAEKSDGRLPEGRFDRTFGA